MHQNGGDEGKGEACEQEGSTWLLVCSVKGRKQGSLLLEQRGQASSKVASRSRPSGSGSAGREGELGVHRRSEVQLTEGDLRGYAARCEERYIGGPSGVCASMAKRGCGG